MISKDIYQAAYFLEKNDIIAIPTETVYGLAANIYSEIAIKKIFETKGRPQNNPLIVHIGTKDAVFDLVTHIPEKAKILIDKFWPGPLTLVLPKKDTVSNSITSGKDTVAIRMPNHPDTLKLLQLIKFPIAAPSANPFGSISPTTAQHVANYFENTIPMILDGGDCTNGIESTIIGFENEIPVLYRLGSIAVEDIESEIGAIHINNFEEQKPNAPGMMLKHYAPSTPTLLVSNVTDAIDHYKNKKIGLLTFTSKYSSPNLAHQEILSNNSNINEAATNLYAAMHRLDRLHLDLIIAEEFPNNQLGRAINDRLKRASKKE
ncbi:L-threonylcarbamoyladenylate synthase [Flavobacterium dankookense]|uniref:Threonylcarbamoyl-AMP synthase n=1 Tax=Flavobacterium dankookense TaxID=706186 RepID=A0A4R6QGI7_9FLAO|nr:L-threonylcarbamoyladenylate synthase [Flavobacterium dankookense]TDP61166.1 translation factor SUA5 [Flavobacterium dankookense]